MLIHISMFLNLLMHCHVIIIHICMIFQSLNRFLYYITEKRTLFESDEED